MIRISSWPVLRKQSAARGLLNRHIMHGDLQYLVIGLVDDHWPCLPMTKPAGARSGLVRNFLVSVPPDFFPPPPSQCRREGIPEDNNELFLKEQENFSHNERWKISEAGKMIKVVINIRDMFRIS